MKPFYLLLALVAVAGGAFIAFGAMKGGGKAATEASAQLMRPASSQDLIQKAKGVTRGQTTAPVKIIVFSDYMCPWCGVYATTIENQVRTTFIDTGKAVEVYQDFPLGGEHKYSFLAARAARCAEDQGKFWEYHGALFSKQRDWSFDAEPPTRKFVTFAKDLGLDRKQFSSCLNSDMHADVVEYNHQLGLEAGVNSTPTVYVNGRKSLNPLDWDKFKAEIEAAAGAGR